ncbi:MAG: hypothetical protein GQ560_03995 [Dehalococcoidia bacterium]|nr:hypothetical protein [Dehalococcoidia bacterium]
MWLNVSTIHRRDPGTILLTYGAGAGTRRNGDGVKAFWVIRDSSGLTLDVGDVFRANVGRVTVPAFIG